MIPRRYDNLGRFLKPGKALLIIGPRRVGKTTLLESFLSRIRLKHRLDSGDNIRTQQVLGSQDFGQILPYVEGYELLAIDEAQQIPNIGMGLKIIVDQRPDIVVIATGSSSFNLVSAVGEPLTGRKRTLHLFPIAQMELREQYSRYELRERLEEFLIYGGYPEVVEATGRRDKTDLLHELADSYLLKDILMLERIKKPRSLLDLLKLLSFQVGNEVSLNELGGQLAMDAKTVNRYLDLLEQSFVIVRIGGFSRNLRKEVTSKQKIYFLDNGIRNAVISQFNPLSLRNDIGALWENFVVCERLKKLAYNSIYGSTYYWRTYDGQEIDWVEDRDGRLFGYECKWSSDRRAKVPSDWKGSYGAAEFSVVTPDNYMDFVA